MAVQTRYYLSVSLIDSQRKVSNIRLQVQSAAGAAWLAALDAAAREATPLGVFASTLMSMSLGNLWAHGVIMEDVDDARTSPGPNDDVYNFDKFTVGYRAGLDNYVFTIPARSDAFNMGSDGVNLLIESGASATIASFITQAESLVVPKNGETPIDIQYIKVNS